MRAGVLVVGGGPAGSVAARMLAREGKDVILLERDPAFVKPCGGGIPSTGLDEFGIPHVISEREVRKIRVVSPGGRLAEAAIRDGFIAIVERGKFDAFLREDARKAGARIIEGRFEGFEDANGPVISKISLTGGSPAFIESDYVIAADGISSRARASLGLKPVPSVYTLSISGISANESSVAPGIPSAGDACEFWLGTRHLHLDDTPGARKLSQSEQSDRLSGFYSWVFPSRGGGLTVGTGSLSADSLRLYLFGFMKRRGFVAEKGMLKGFRVPIWDKRLTKPGGDMGMVSKSGRVLLVGDAAGQAMPLTFEGIYYSMKSASFAAEAVINKKPLDYPAMWRKRFHLRFVFMRKIWEGFRRSDDTIEKFFEVFSSPPVMEEAVNVWINKQITMREIIGFMGAFRKFLTG